MFDRADQLLPGMRWVLAGLSDGRLRPPPVTAFRFEDAAAAQRELETGRTVGKLVLEVKDTR
jgi:NADPH:quinone reductase-like Zn-dependent oxidoreductase